MPDRGRARRVNPDISRSSVREHQHSLSRHRRTDYRRAHRPGDRQGRRNRADRVSAGARLCAGRHGRGGAGGGVRGRAGDALRRVRPDRLARYHVGNLVGIMAPGLAAAPRPPADRAGGGGTALVGDPSGKTADPGGARRRRSRRTCPTSSSSSTAIPRLRRRAVRRQPGGAAAQQRRLAAAACATSSSCATSAATSPSTRCWRSRPTRTGWRSTGLNFVEFNYRLVQAYDFLHLYRTYGCLLQMGGSDQWANITGGVDLIRRVEGAQAFALVTPLVTDRSGQKMGKTEGNAVWLDAEHDDPLRLLPVLGQRRRRRCRPGSCGSSPSCRRTGSPT